VPTLLDYDPEGGVSVVYVDSWTWLGATVTDNGDGTVTYDPRMEGSGGWGPGTPGRAEFAYGVCDESDHQGWGTVHVYVTDDQADDWPWAVFDEAWTTEDQAVTIDVLANDMDGEGAVTLTYAGPAGGTLGTVQANPDGTVTYTPPENYYGQDYFGYEIRDTAYHTDAFYVQVTMASVNDAPVANPDEASAWREQQIGIYVRTNDTDVDGDTLLITSVNQPDDCEVWFDENVIHFTALEPFESTSTVLNYTVADGHGGTDSATATVEVNYMDLDIKDLDDEQEDAPGGLVVKNADNNNAPRQEIVLQAPANPTWAGNVVLTKSTGGGSVRVFDAATGGNEITFNGTDNAFFSGTLPRSLYVEGSGESLLMGDVTLTLAPQGVGFGSDSVNFTVLWVDCVGLRWFNNVSADNEARETYNSVTIGDSYALGLQEYENPLEWGLGTEAYGLVHPLEFDYSYLDLAGAHTANVYLDRDSQVRWWLNSGTPLGEGEWRNFDDPAVPPPGNDTSGEAWRDDDQSNSSPVGFIYDLDVPGIYEYSRPVDEIRRFRANFKIFATVQLPDGQLVRASAITTYHVALSIKQMESPEGIDWQLVYDVTGDNSLTYQPPSSLPVTWDLQ